MQSHDSSECLHSMKEELDAFEENETCDLVPLPPRASLWFSISRKYCVQSEVNNTFIYLYTS